jgi:hypothetical protein
MAKPNYNKMEDAIEKGLHSLKVESLLRQADEAQGKIVKEENEKRELTPKQIMIIVEHELRWMYKQDHHIYKILKIKKKKIDEFIKLVNTPGVKLKKEELDEIASIKEGVEMLKKTRFSPEKDDSHVEKEIGRHIYKRHNLREKWLPLDTHADWNKYNKKK